MGNQTLSFSPSSPSKCIVFSAALFPRGLSCSDSPEMMERGVSLPEDSWSSGGGSSEEEFIVDDLLDFSNSDDFQAEQQNEHEEVEESNWSDNRCDSASVGSNCSPVSFFVEAVAGGEFTVPVEELADLEWLSNFVEDSFSCRTGSLQYSQELGDRTPKKPAFPLRTPVPVKARSKRHRTGRAWACRYGFHESPSSSETIPLSDSVLTVPDRKVQPERRLNRPGNEPHNFTLVRRCSHCLVQKTPQWRNGPLGSKTLCNACGVRYKSGRLLPEYRPARSLTFLSNIHSNSHRKVIEMRRQKEKAMIANAANQSPEGGFPVVHNS